MPTTLSSIVTKVYYTRMDGHFHLRVFVGKDSDHLAKSGDLILREEEFYHVHMLFSKHVVLINEGEDEEVWGQKNAV